MLGDLLEFRVVPNNSKSQFFILTNINRISSLTRTRIKEETAAAREVKRNKLRIITRTDNSDSKILVEQKSLNE